MTTSPICPTHGKPLRAGKKGGWFCTSKMPDGSWCPFKSSGQNPPPIPQHVPPGATAPSQGPSTTTDEAIRLRLCEALMKGGAAPDDALFHAKAMFEWVKEGK